MGRMRYVSSHSGQISLERTRGMKGDRKRRANERSYIAASNAKLGSSGQDNEVELSGIGILLDGEHN